MRRVIAFQQCICNMKLPGGSAGIPIVLVAAFAVLSAHSFALAQTVPSSAEVKAEATPAPPVETAPPEAEPVAEETVEDSYRTRRLQAMQLDKPLLTEADEENFRKIRTKFGTWLRKGEFVGNREQEQVIKEGLKYHVYRLANKEIRPVIHKERQGIVRRYLNGAAQLERNVNAKKKARAFVMKEVELRCKDLLDNNLVVRENAAKLLGQLELLPPVVGQDGQPAEPYLEAYKTLLEIVNDPDQFIVVKIFSLPGLQNILRRGRPDGRIQMEIAGVLVNQLDDKTSHWWYQRDLCLTLSAIQTPRELVGQRRPIAVMALTSAMDDSERNWRVRSAAAFSLGRVGTDSGIRIEPIAWKIVELCKLMIEDYDQAPDAVHWHTCFRYLYFAFHHGNTAELNAKAGLINKAPNATVRKAFQQIVPVARHFEGTARTSPFDAETVNNLSEWLKDNFPQSMQYDQAVPALKPQPVKQQAGQVASPTDGERR